jgi:cysteinyl-tRNA synthetase
LALSCGGGGGGSDDDGGGGPIDPIYRQYMREFVQGIGAYARGMDPSFIVIPQNGQELLTLDGEAGGAPAVDYVAAIDGVGREDLFYGYYGDNRPTPAADRDYMIGFLDAALGVGLAVLVTDYCWTPAKMDDSFARNQAKGYVSFAAPSRGLEVIPAYPAAPRNLNTDNVTTLAQAKNFLYLIDPGEFADKASFLAAVQNISYDLVLIDLFFTKNNPLTSAEMTSLKTKKGGGSRLAICYMSIGEAESYRWYWDPAWKTNPPPWLAGENPHWAGNYKVRYWDPHWQAIIYGNDSSYTKKLLDAGCDGAYLDLIDAFEHFE